jgi:protein-L-isoaspartate(D-aspartate) O-methyltransferase
MVERDLAARDITDRRVLEAMGRIPRERFVWERDLSQAYADRPLRIGEGQTISQPYMVALMTQLLRLEGRERVLEIGTGSGYQTAVLAELAREVYTVERLAALSESAGARLKELGYMNVRFLVGDGTLGWEEHAPYDAVIVTAGAPSVPESLRRELAPGGRLVCPVGSRDSQRLEVVRRTPDGFATEGSIDCIFVRLVGAEGWRE